MMEFIDPGRFRAELIVEDAIETGDGAGGVSRHWVEVATVFGHVEPVRARLRHGADQRHADITHRITIRHRSGIFRRMRFRRNERIFEIETITDPDESRRYLICEAREAGA